MRLLFISFWSAGEPLTKSTIIPYLEIMSANPKTERVILVTVERTNTDVTLFELGRLVCVDHYPLATRFRAIDPLSKLDLFTGRVSELVALVKDQNIDVIDAKGSLAGGIAYLVSRRTGIPFVVESFEPHSDYMVDCGVWGRRGVSYRVARWLEQKQKDNARAIITVTNNYRRQLMLEGVDAERIKIIPSITNTEAFAFDRMHRERIRSELGWQNELVGVYVGKFGGLYYEREAFALFDRIRDLVGPSFRLLLITVVPEEQVRRWINETGFPQDHVVVRFVDHSEVPAWLSASDLAFSLHRITLSSPYFSPVKNGEYWASGLPVLMPHGVSDDFRIVEEWSWAGAVFDPARPDLLPAIVEHLTTLIATPGHRERIMDLAVRIRGHRVVHEVYQDVFGL